MKFAIAIALGVLCSSSFAAVIGKDVRYPAGDTAMQGFLAYDDAVSAPRGGVLIVPEWWGVNDYARKRARMLATEGYVAFVVDMYGNGQVATTPDQAGQLAGAVNKNPPLAYSRFRAAENYLASQLGRRHDKMAALGYCFGGGIVLNMARAGLPLKFIGSYHGVLATDVAVKPGDIVAKLAVFHGAADPVVPPAQVEAFKAEMAAAKADLSFTAYPGAQHTFTNREADSYAAQFGLPLKYDPAADADSWAQTLKFLAQTLK